MYFSNTDLTVVHVLACDRDHGSFCGSSFCIAVSAITGLC